MNKMSLRAIKRSGKLVDFDYNKITVAITKSFMSIEDNQQDANIIHDKAQKLTDQIVDLLFTRYGQLGAVSIEEIQDQVELALMRSGEQKTARNYILYREKQTQIREKSSSQKQINIRLKRTDGSSVALDTTWLAKKIHQAIGDIKHVQVDPILKEVAKNLFDNIDLRTLDKALIMAARVFIDKDPNYSFVTARLLLDRMALDVLDFLSISNNANHTQLKQYYPELFIKSIKFGTANGYFNPLLAELFDLEELGKELDSTKDFKFNYLGMQTINDRYLMHHKKTRFELPQTFFMRVAMGLAIKEDDPTARAKDFYNLLSSFDFVSSTPTLFNSGCIHSQLSSCYLTSVPDDLGGIYESIKENALLSKWAGGLGNDWTQVRSLGAKIKGTNGESQGVVPFLKVANDTAVAVNQGGKRKGAVCAYLETWHYDIEEFLELRKNTGDERRRTHDMNTANWIPDLFMQRVFLKQDWTLFSPNDVPDLHDLYGEDFNNKYKEYEKIAQAGNIRSKSIAATDLWRKMLSMLFETGHPWITFKDPCNIRSPQSHVGRVRSSNLCTEITLNTNDDEIAVCNLGSVNLSNHTDENGIDKTKLQQTIKTAIRMLDNVIEINYYAVEKAKNSNMRHRPIGLGLMGFHDSLFKLKIPYASVEAVEFADTSMELISYFAIEASSDIAQEKGSYSSYKGSLWDKGIMPIDSLKQLAEIRGKDFIEVDISANLDWQALKDKIAKQGMRNSNVLAIAPTATIANIANVSQSIEPIYQNLFVKSNLSGEFSVINSYLVNDLRKLNLWDDAMINDLKYYDGSIASIKRIPKEIKDLYAIAFEIDPKWIIEAASRRQKWIDQSQSLNLYISVPDGKKLDKMYKMAWIKGLKTTYYLRSMGATTTEKSAITDNRLNKVSADIKICAIEDPDCEACQ